MQKLLLFLAPILVGAISLGSPNPATAQEPATLTGKILSVSRDLAGPAGETISVARRPAPPGGHIITGWGDTQFLSGGQTIVTSWTSGGMNQQVITERAVDEPVTKFRRRHAELVREMRIEYPPDPNQQNGFLLLPGWPERAALRRVA